MARMPFDYSPESQAVVYGHIFGEGQGGPESVMRFGAIARCIGTGLKNFDSGSTLKPVICSTTLLGGAGEIRAAMRNVRWTPGRQLSSRSLPIITNS
jgi:hypothetical protein